MHIHSHTYIHMYIDICQYINICQYIIFGQIYMVAIVLTIEEKPFPSELSQHLC